MEIAGNLAENVPPKPQQVSAAPISTSSRPLHLREQFARRTFVVQLAQAVAAVVERDLVRKLRAEIGHAELVHEETGEFVALGRDCSGQRFVWRAGEQFAGKTPSSSRRTNRWR